MMRAHLSAAKKGKESSMWKATEFLKNKKADIALYQQEIQEQC